MGLDGSTLMNGGKCITLLADSISLPLANFSSGFLHRRCRLVVSLYHLLIFVSLHLLQQVSQALLGDRPRSHHYQASKNRIMEILYSQQDSTI